MTPAGVDVEPAGMEVIEVLGAELDIVWVVVDEDDVDEGDIVFC
jgi:hypothetical protein